MFHTRNYGPTTEEREKETTPEAEAKADLAFVEELERR
jgi:hypothetical protein